MKQKWQCKTRYWNKGKEEKLWVLSYLSSNKCISRERHNSPNPFFLEVKKKSLNLLMSVEKNNSTTGKDGMNGTNHTLPSMSGHIN